MDPTATAQRLERMLAGPLGLAPVPLPPALARAEGELRGAPLFLETHAYGGDLAKGRVVLLRGKDLAIANIVFASAAERAAPVLGMDVVSLANGTLVAADLTPTLPPSAERDAQLAELGRRHRAHPFLPSAGPLHAPYDTLFSPHHVFVRVVDPTETDAANAVLLDLASTFTSFATSAPRPELAASVTEGLASYMAAHKKDVRIPSVLSRAFGAAFADRFVSEIMFPPPGA